MKILKNFLIFFLFISVFSGCEKNDAGGPAQWQVKAFGVYKVDATLIPVASPNDVAKYTFDSKIFDNSIPDHPADFMFTGELLGNPHQGFICKFTSPTTIIMDKMNPGSIEWLYVSGSGTYLNDKTIDMDIAVWDTRQGEPINQFQKSGVKIADIRAKFTPKQ